MKRKRIRSPEKKHSYDVSLLLFELELRAQAACLFYLWKIISASERSQASDHRNYSFHLDCHYSIALSSLSLAFKRFRAFGASVLFLFDDFPKSTKLHRLFKFVIKCRHRCSLLKWYAHFLKLAFEVSLFRESEFIQKCFRLNLLARHIFQHPLNSKSYTNYTRWYNGKLVCNARNSIFPEKSDAKYLNWV